LAEQLSGGGNNLSYTLGAINNAVNPQADITAGLEQTHTPAFQTQPSQAASAGFRVDSIAKMLATTSAAKTNFLSNKFINILLRRIN
jgi:hypothetical protein